MVTGANGQLGQCFRTITPNLGTKDRWFYSDVDTLDITDPVAVEEMVSAIKPDIIVNCAAYTNVDKAEDNADAAMQINAVGPKNLANSARGQGATLIHISTDYVYDGTLNRPYREDDDSVNPLNMYGRTKALGEQEIIDSGCKYLIFRTAWLYSEYGSNFVKTVKRFVDNGKDMDVVFDQIGTPTYALDLATMIIAVITCGQYKHTGIYHYTNEGVASWYDFACAIYRGLTELPTGKIHPIKSEEYKTAAKRPAYSVLDKTKVKETFKTPIKHWEDALTMCLYRLQNNK
jgi:dTDP-4-dehydrorhamnose reductase